MSYTQHPLSAAFPRMSPDDFQSLKGSIERIGVQNPITVFEGMVIDGWHRFSASQELGMACPEVELGDVDPVDFVKAQNKERRHLSAGAWALIEVELWQWKPAHRSSPQKAELSSALFDPEQGANRPQRSSAQMAESAGVTDRTIRHAKRVHSDAASEIKDAVKAGTVSLKDAHAVADLPKDEQAALAADGPDAIKKAARAKAAKPAPDAAPVAEAAPPTVSQAQPANDDLAEARHAIIDLATENEWLRDRLAVEQMDANEEGKAEAASTIADLRERVRTLEAENDALKTSRDTYMQKVSEMQKQISYWRKRAEKVVA